MWHHWSGGGLAREAGAPRDLDSNDSTYLHGRVKSTRGVLLSVVLPGGHRQIMAFTQLL